MMLEIQALVKRNDKKWDRPPKLAKFIAVKTQDKNCEQYAATVVGHPI